MEKIWQFGKKIVRNFASSFTRLKLIPPPSIRENKVSVTIRVKNEVDWIEYCLLSFKDFADEILIANHGSTDGTIQIIKDFIEKHTEIPIKLYDRSNDTYLEISNFLIQNSKYRWIMRVDADHVAKTSGKYDILKLKKRILQLNSNIYYTIKLEHVFLLLDIFHISKVRPKHKEMWLFNYSPDLICYREGLYTDKVWIPLYYRVLEFSEPFVFHINVRPKQRYLERIYWGPWRREGSIIPFSEYMNQRIKIDFATDSVEEAGDKYLKQILGDVKPLDPAIYDGYPAVLKPCLENPRYKLIYENGKIVKRIEFDKTVQMDYSNF